MGGPGSGRWHEHEKAPLVNDCLIFDFAELAEDTDFRDGARGSTAAYWENYDEFPMEYAICQGPDTLYLILTYSICWTSKKIELPIRLEARHPHFGGTCWWGRCSLACGNKPCNRSVRKLYLPLYARHFGCRQCYGLTYRSVQEEYIWPIRRGQLLVEMSEALSGPPNARSGSRRRGN